MLHKEPNSYMEKTPHELHSLRIIWCTEIFCNNVTINSTSRKSWLIAPPEHGDASMFTHLDVKFDKQQLLQYASQNFVRLLQSLQIITAIVSSLPVHPSRSSCLIPTHILVVPWKQEQDNIRRFQKTVLSRNIVKADRS